MFDFFHADRAPADPEEIELQRLKRKLQRLHDGRRRDDDEDADDVPSAPPPVGSTNDRGISTEVKDTTQGSSMPDDEPMFVPPKGFYLRGRHEQYQYTSCIQWAEQRRRQAILIHRDMYIEKLAHIHYTIATQEQWTLRLYDTQCEEAVRRRWLESQSYTLRLDVCIGLELYARRQLYAERSALHTRLQNIENQEWIAARRSHLESLRTRELDAVTRMEQERAVLSAREHALAVSRRQASEAEIVARVDIQHCERSEREIIANVMEMEYGPLRCQEMYDTHCKEVDLTTLVWTEKPYEECYVAEVRQRAEIIALEKQTWNEKFFREMKILAPHLRKGSRT